jgi:hypothetical protein
MFFIAIGIIVAIIYSLFAYSILRVSGRESRLEEQFKD